MIQLHFKDDSAMQTIFGWMFGGPDSLWKIPVSMLSLVKSGEIRGCFEVGRGSM